MSAAAVATARARATGRHNATAYGVTPARVLRSEWIKLRSLRSTSVIVAGAAVVMIACGALLAYLYTATPNPRGGPPAPFDPTVTSLAGTNLAQLAMGVLGVLAATGEYATGMIRATFSAVPKRLPVLWAKLAVVAAVGAATMVPAAFGAVLAGQAVLAANGTATTLASGELARAVVGAGLYLAGVGLIGTALGFIVRSTAAAVTTLFGLLAALPVLARLLPASFAAIVPYLPGTAGQAIFLGERSGAVLTPWSGFAVFSAYLAVAAVVAAVLVVRRDV